VTIVVSLAVSLLAVSGDTPIFAQDTGQVKHSVRVPNGLAFSEFNGYDTWQTGVILANPLMINADQSGIPGNGKPFPHRLEDGKVHWNPKKLETLPTATVPARPTGRRDRTVC
jgi:hypothetical protein